MTDDERRHLAELAQQLATEDPALAKKLTAPPAAAAATHRLLWVCWTALVVGILVCLAAVVGDVPLMFGIGLAIDVAALVAAGSLLLTRRRTGNEPFRSWSS